MKLQMILASLALARMGCPFMTGEVPDSIRITLTPNVK